MDRPGLITDSLDRWRPWPGPSVTRTCGRDVSITTLQPVDISECELCALSGKDLLALIRSRVPASANDVIATSVLLRAHKAAPATLPGHSQA